MPLPPFVLTVQDFTPPSLPPTPADVDPSLIRSPLIPNPLSPTSPLYFTVSLPSGRDKDPLYPATHLQMVYFYKGTAETINTSLITNQNIVSTAGSEGEPRVCTFEVPPESINRVKVNHGESPSAEVRVRAWRNEKILGMWPIGRVEDLGLEGFKSQPIHLRRVEQWKASAAEKEAKTETKSPGT